jgi:hypothetical protein
MKQKYNCIPHINLNKKTIRYELITAWLELINIKPQNQNSDQDAKEPKGVVGVCNKGNGL